MKGLNWFQARDLAKLEKRAIRREGWTYWLIFRFKLWIISTIEADIEVRRVARAAVIDAGTGVVTGGDFHDSEFLAKDWTDEVWEGGSLPPCTTPGPAAQLAGNSTGGTAAWSLTDACGGDGQGGNILPPVDTGSGSDDDGYEPDFALELDPTGLAVTPDGGGGTCWSLSHPSTVVFHALFQDLAVVSPDTIAGRGWIAPLAVDLTVTPAFDGSIPGASAPVNGTFAVNILTVAFAAVALTPGVTYHCRVDAVYSWGGAYTAYASFTLAAACP